MHFARYLKFEEHPVWAVLRDPCREPHLGTGQLTGDRRLPRMQMGVRQRVGFHHDKVPVRTEVWLESCDEHSVLADREPEIVLVPDPDLTFAVTR